MIKILVAAAMAFAAVAVPARAFAETAPQRLSDAQLDGVTGGTGSLFLGPAVWPPHMRLPVEGPTVLVNPGDPFFRDVNVLLGTTTNGSPLPVAALSQPAQAASAR